MKNKFFTDYSHWEEGDFQPRTSRKFPNPTYDMTEHNSDADRLLHVEHESTDERVLIEPPIQETHHPKCESCNKTFTTSWLYNSYHHEICDDCQDPEKHKLISIMEASHMYLLKVRDLDEHDPPLPYITCKKPGNNIKKLYLLLQVEKRAMEIWGTKELLEEEILYQKQKRVLAKMRKYLHQMNKYHKQMKRSAKKVRRANATRARVFQEEWR